MRTYGGQWCNTIKTQTGEAKVGSTYYDLERVAYQIAAYTGDSTWNACANDAEIGYRDNYVETAIGEFGPGAVPGYWVFTDGLRRDYELTGDVKSKAAVWHLQTAAAICNPLTPLEWTASATLMREQAYCVNAYLDNEALGAGLVEPRTSQLLDQLLDGIDATITLRYKAEATADVPDVCKGKTYAQPFYMGLAMKTLIEYNSVHPDPRIPAAVKRMADFMWDKLRYQPISATQGARFQYSQCSGPDGAWNLQTTGNGPTDDLNLLIAPGYAWLYAKTGDPIYRDRADQMWIVGVNDATQNGLNSKQFNQNYLWSFDFVKYRSQ